MSCDIILQKSEIMHSWLNTKQWRSCWKMLLFSQIKGQNWHACLYLGMHFFGHNSAIFWPTGLKIVRAIRKLVSIDWAIGYEKCKISCLFSDFYFSGLFLQKNSFGRPMGRPQLFSKFSGLNLPLIKGEEYDLHREESIFKQG